MAETENPGLSSLRLWWVIVAGESELAGEPIPDDAVVLHFMGYGASHQVTAADLRQAFPGTQPGFADSTG